MKENKGITLVALIITIIVMIILVSTTVSILIGENTPIKQAKRLQSKSDLERLKEDILMATIDKKIDDYVEGGDMLNCLNKIADITIDEIAVGTYHVTRGTAEVTVYEDGDIEEGQVEIWGGTIAQPTCPEFKENATEEGVWDWYIYKPSELQFLQEFVNNGNSLTGDVRNLTPLVAEANRSKVVITENKTKVYLMNNLDMGAREGATKGDVEKRWEKAADGVTDSVNQTSYNWTPIGADNDTKKFKGIFEGQDHTIRGVYVNRTANSNGIFGNSNTIKNLTIKDSYIKGGTGTGGIVGALRTGEVLSCHNANTIVILKNGSYYSVGGVVGFCQAPVSDCTNTGGVYAYGAIDDRGQISTYIGGVLGIAFAGDVSNCRNYGEVINKSQRHGDRRSCWICIFNN